MTTSDWQHLNAGRANRRAFEAATDQTELIRYLAERAARQEQLLEYIAAAIHRIEVQLEKTRSTS